MTTNSAAILRNGHNIRRYQSYTTKKDMLRNGKEAKTVDSTNRIDLASFMENKNEKINNIDVQLEIHNAEIQKNQDIINQLNRDFVCLKNLLDKEREATIAQSRKNQLLKEETDKKNKTLILKDSKIEKYSSRIQELEKQNQDLHILAANNAEQSKMIATLKSQIGSMQENIDTLTLTIIEKNQEAKRQKQKYQQLHQQTIKGKQSAVNQKLQSKDALIGNLKQTIKDLTSQVSNTLEQKNTIAHKLLKIETEINRYQQEARVLETAVRTLTAKQNEYKSKIQSIEINSKQDAERAKSKEEELASLKLNFNELKCKFNELTLVCSKKQKEIALQASKIDKMGHKINQLQNIIGETYKEKDKLKNFEDKFSNLKNKMQSLQNAYCSISPQIQCPFGHELKSAVTIIPCGHNYCLNCKKGYAKDCLQCNGKLKVEAVYRNELMDDIIGMVTAIKHIIEVLQ